MCLGVPGKIVSTVDGSDGQIVVVELSGRQVRTNIGVLDESVQPGDWVIVHMGFAMETISESEAARILRELDMTSMLHAAVAGDGDSILTSE